ncbi:pentatricopeptide repeat (PPR) superfamily protein [Artemisia annua]|uniref:Pentatricopeptide repeat (PPR) superfamily protein n=1 Tax=Artemisia annua TaxID=35608 RepID=A0A2U1LZL1_ARTAN|nr:pentatricopeptide repeat (PPR) superfamily protein [Artemisia annua]
MFNSLSSNSSCDSPQSLDGALNLFNKLLIHKRPLPSVVEFHQIFGVVNEAKRYSTSLDIFKQLGFLGVSVDDYTMKALVFSCCKLYRTNEAFAALGWNLKRAAMKKYYALKQKGRVSVETSE